MDSTPLLGWEIHGFRTAADLDIDKLMKDASTRWFRPNEVHAILSNHTRFAIQPQPIDIPESGTVMLYDRKMLRNFRKDGHNWKKKKDGKTVQEAHEKLKIGNEERIHVYYARNEDDPNFYRRCYWLLDKNLERIVLVHYRQTSEETTVEQHFTSPEFFPKDNKLHHGSPSTSGSGNSDMSGCATLSEEINSGGHHTIYAGKRKCKLGNDLQMANDPQMGKGERADLHNYELSLHDINTLDWEDLVETPACVDSSTCSEGVALSFEQQMQNESRNSVNSDNLLSFQGTSLGYPIDINAHSSFSCAKQISGGYFQMGKGQEHQSPLLKTINSNSQMKDLHLNPASCTKEETGAFNNDVFLSQNSFGQWNYMNDDSLGLLNGLELEHSKMNGCSKSVASVAVDHSLSQQQIFCITDVSPAWAYCTEETKVLVIGYFHDTHKHLEGSKLSCFFGEICVTAEIVQAGVYRCKSLPQKPGLVNLYLTLDGCTPISQVSSFEYRPISRVKLNDRLASPEDDTGMLRLRDFQLQMRLAHLLFSSTNNTFILSSRIQPKSQKEANRFVSVTSPSIDKDWICLLQSSSNNAVPYESISQNLFELVLKNKLQEWLLEKVAEGCKATARDSQGQGVIHLCAMLDYAWAVSLFSYSGLSLDFRDARGWTALHWASYCGRENMVAVLLSAGANPSLVTDPTSESPGGSTAADLASSGGYEGLAAYLAEKGLAAHFEAMTLSGNITAPLATNPLNSENLYSSELSEQDICLKESLAAYRNAADAADRIQTALRDRTLKLQTKEVRQTRPEMEATSIVAALKIQHAFRKYNGRKMLRAAAQIQSHFRTWQTRRNFLNMRRQAIRIQAVFRGHQVRRQYKKIIWSVGVLEKAVLRWRLKRKGLRGVQATETMRVDKEEESTAEEDFYRISREQAEDRVKRSVVRVQTMFRSYRAQQEYRRMKQAHEQAKLEYKELMSPRRW